MIEISSEGYKTFIEETDSWDETKSEIIGAAHRVILARDTGRRITGVTYEKNN